MAASLLREWEEETQQLSYTIYRELVRKTSLLTHDFSFYVGGIIIFAALVQLYVIIAIPHEDTRQARN
jgi:hypothetical protein